MPEHMQVPAYTHLILIIQECDSETKTCNTLRGGHSGNELHVCVQMKGREKQLDYGSINAITELLFRNRGGFKGLLGSCDPTLYPAWVRLFVSGVVEQSSMASGS